MIVTLGRNEDNQPTLTISEKYEPKIISEEDFKEISKIVANDTHTQLEDEYILKVYLYAEPNYPKYKIGEYVIYNQRETYYLGMISEVSETNKNLYFVDFNNGEQKWLEACYLSKIANGDVYTILV